MILPQTPQNNNIPDEFLRGGWFKCPRSIIKNPLLKGNRNRLLVLIWLLSNSKWEERQSRFKGKTITLKPGQLTCGCKQIGGETGVNPKTVSSILGLLSDEKLIEKRSSNECTLVTLAKWLMCDEDETQKENPLAFKRETNKDYKKKGRMEESIRKEIIKWMKTKETIKNADAYLDKILQKFELKAVKMAWGAAKRQGQNPSKFYELCGFYQEKIDKVNRDL